MRIFMCFAICVLCISPAFAGKPIVRGIIFTAKDREPPENDIKIHNAFLHAQIFFASKMDNPDDDFMTFDLERDDDERVVIHEIAGKQELTEYPTLESLADEIDGEDNLGGFSNFGEVRVVFISDIDEIWKDVIARHEPGCSPLNHLECGFFSCRDYVFIPVDYKGDLSFLVAHELSHAFGLGHRTRREFVMYKDIFEKDKLDKKKLSADELRWLSCIKFFTGNQPVFSLPRINDVQVPDWLPLKLITQDSIEIRIDFDSKFPLHQVYVLQGFDGTVLDYAYFFDDTKTATFNLETRYLQRTTKVIVRTLDNQGNYVAESFDLSDFSETVIELPLAFKAPSMPIRKIHRTWGDIKSQ